jgi:hypothetical protein
MNSRIDQITKGLISLAVMLMFTVALIAGQARANLQPDASAIDQIALGTRMSVILDAESLRTLESLSHLIDTVTALPIDIELSIDELSLHAGEADEAGSDDLPVQ